MNQQKLLKNILIGLWLTIILNPVYSGIPLWSFSAITPTTFSIPKNANVTVQYRVTNQSQKTHTLIMTSIPGITQITTLGYCTNPFVLGPQKSCVLNLNVNGDAINSNVTGGPVLCQQGNASQCYQPSRDTILNITKGPNSYTVGGSLYGLLETVVLANNGSAILPLTTDGSFTFLNAQVSGSPYSVTVQTQPSTQFCTVNDGYGTITNSNVTNVSVICSTNTRTVGGTVSGLTASESLVLQNNNENNLSVTSNGSFVFSNPVAQGANYNVSVLTQPSTQTCTVNNGSGTATTSNITNVQVICSNNAYRVGGTVSGLDSAGLVLKNNSVDVLPIINNGSFFFPIPIAQGADYNVTVFRNPDNQICTVSNGNGTMGGANVTNIGVTCTLNTTSLSTSLTTLLLSVTGHTEYGITGTPSSGVARTITITNNGSAPAVNLNLAFPSWPSGTSSSTTCGSTLAASSSCTITITPGNTATSNGTLPCSSGSAPIPGTISITSDNANSVSINAYILNYACIYQNGYVYAFDDTTPTTTSVGGKAVSTKNNQLQPYGIIWSSNGNGSNPLDSSHDLIYGISETSTVLSANPDRNQVPGQVACEGKTDGACNTNNIYIYYQNYSVGAPVKNIYYATGVCKETIGGYSDWYLPAICELSYDTSLAAAGCGSVVSPALQNIQSNVLNYNFLNLFSGWYWSSTEGSTLPTYVAWIVFFASEGSNQLDYDDKGNKYGVRCSRVLTP